MRSPRAPSRIRAGYTLLEVLLASAIAVILMSALYVGMDVQLRFADAGREGVDQQALVRQLLRKISSDVEACLSPITAPPGSSSSATTATAAASTTSPAPASNTTPAPASGTSATGTGATASDGTESLAFNVVTPFNGGVQGDAAMLSLWVSRVPSSTSPIPEPESEVQPSASSDLRRVTYWLAEGGAGGLARHELARVSGNDDETQLPPPDENKFVIATEVAELSFRYFDGTNWTETWDGTALGTDGKTPIGPPRAIEITLGVRSPSDPENPDKIKRYRHVVAIGAANAQPAQMSEDMTGTTTPSTTTPATGGTP